MNRIAFIGIKLLVVLVLVISIFAQAIYAVSEWPRFHGQLDFTLEQIMVWVLLPLPVGITVWILRLPAPEKRANARCEAWIIAFILILGGSWCLQTVRMITWAYCG